MARSLAATPPPSLGSAISLPFSLTEETRIWSRRRRANTASLLSATRSPETTLPSRVLPFHTKAGIGSSYRDATPRGRCAPLTVGRRALIAPPAAPVDAPRFEAWTGRHRG